MSPPQIDSNQTTWNLSELNLVFKYAPFYHCQGVPIIFTRISSSGIDSSNFQTNGDKIVIQYSSTSRLLVENIRNLQELSGRTKSVFLQKGFMISKIKMTTKKTLTENNVINPGDVLIFNVTVATNTIIPLSNNATLSIYVNNTIPEYKYFPSLLSAEKPFPTSIQILYGSINDSKFTSSTVVVSDIDSDSIFLSLYIDGEVDQNSPYKLNNQNDFESFTLETANLNVGANTLKMSIWDMFHISSPVQISLTLNLTYNPAPHFTEDLPANLAFPICAESTIQLSEVQDFDNDFNCVRLLNSNSWVEIDGLSFIINPNANQLGLRYIQFYLIDFQNHTTQYSLNLSLQNTFTFKPFEILSQSVTYPNVLDLSIGDAVSQFLISNISVLVIENMKTANYAKFNEESKSIEISGYSVDQIGSHNLTISIFDYCYMEYFDSSVTISILPNLPPAVVGQIDETIGYQGQSMIVQRNINLKDLFYDPVDKVDFVITVCIDNENNNIASTMMRYVEPSMIIESTFYKSYIGTCKAGILGYDVLYQSALLQYHIKIIKCPQNNCLYCEGPNQYDCTKCVNGYVLENSTKQCTVKTRYFDKWVIISFTIIICLLALTTEYNADIPILLLEHISIYFLLFMIKNTYTLSINYYFEELISVVTNMSSLFFPLYKRIGVAFQGQLSCSFSLNCSSMILFVICFVLFRKLLMKSFKWEYLQDRFKYKIISKYLMWNMVFIYFCALMEIESIIYNFGLLISFFLTTCCFILCLFYFYCFVLNNKSDCLLCNIFRWIKDIKDEFIMISNIDKANYSYFIRYNWIRKILFSLVMSLFYKYSFSPYLYAFSSIPLQVIYFCLSFVVSSFHSPDKGLIFVINESMMTVVVFMVAIIYMNTKTNDLGYLINFSEVMLNIIITLNCIIICKFS